MSAKTSYVIWTRGLRGPELSVLATRGNAPELNEYERRFVITPPIPLPPDHAGLSLDVLASIYPAPFQDDDAPSPDGTLQSLPPAAIAVAA